MMSHKEKLKVLETNLLHCPISNTNHTRIVLELKMGLCGEKLVFIHLSL
jgi:hypothetical protein